ncbi:hypothetical protein [Gluconacetobacter asukensis]|uniref:Uncharacterized protein n=1 Tax=Gluconacetobacter asukensis TaxID=1017181 RepID=A0A7W4J0P1_9PROT|nr:hypothetical protein [Gluconacetobacter asukensis]MBB2172474.1 hypothetical protein [Gluconacetobacter asukensis]
MPDTHDPARARYDPCRPIGKYHPELVIGASLACNPGPHVTDLGITDGMSGKIVTDSLIA